jgi:hypothetical protein
MSGGSWDYLYMITADGRIGHASTYRLMADSPELAAYPDARAALHSLAEARDAIEKQHNSLAEIMKAVEWIHSGDWSIDQLNDAILEWRVKKQAEKSANRNG